MTVIQRYFVRESYIVIQPMFQPGMADKVPPNSHVVRLKMDLTNKNKPPARYDNRSTGDR